MDLLLKETGDGGELTKNLNDLAVISGFENMIYLAMFGGNLLQSTPETRFANEQAFDFWGNNLLHPQDTSVQFNSLTEQTLLTTALNSSGVNKIQTAVETDLEFMSAFAEVDVQVSLLDDDVILIAIQVKKLNDLQNQDYVYIWNATLQELTQQQFQTVTNNVIRVKYFDNFFDIFFG